MVKIRLRRVGTRNKPMYRVVVADHRSPRDGDFIEIIGNYNPMTDPETVNMDEEKALKWLKQGAKPTETVSRLLSKSGIMDKVQPSVAKKAGAHKSTHTKTAVKTKSTAEESS